MQRVFDLDWRIGLEPVTAAPEQGAPLEADTPAPDTLPLLASDWQMLLGPVRVKRRLPLAAPDEAAWLRVMEEAPQVSDEATASTRSGDPADDDASATANETTQTASANPSSTVLLAEQETGEGAVLLLTTALDTNWTNLPTKPLFVPLVHETLRGILGSAPRAHRADGHCG